MSVAVRICLADPQIQVRITSAVLDDEDKYNPYHDARGRFTTGAGATFVSIRAGQTQRERDRIAQATGANKPTAKPKSNKPKNSNPNAAAFNQVTKDPATRKAREDKAEAQRQAEGAKAVPKLSAAHDAALKAYSGNAYGSINGALRAGGTHSLTHDLDAAINTSRVTRDTIVFRGLGDPPAGGFKIGATFKDHGYGSSSTRMRVAEGFTGYGGRYHGRQRPARAPGIPAHEWA